VQATTTAIFKSLTTKHIYIYIYIYIYICVCIQALSNDRYKSVLHRVIVSSENERISVPTFYSPSPDAVVAPADALVDDGHPPAYRPFTYQEYYDEFWNMGLQSASCLDRFRPR
jgi:salicylic acid 3-hydroxylase